MPDVFDLYIPQKEQTIGASVTWRHGEEIGVAFAHPLVIDERADADHLAQRLVRIEAEIVTIKRACKKLRCSRRAS